MAQSEKIVLPKRELASQEVFDAISKQSSYIVTVSRTRLGNLSVRNTQSPVAISDILDKMFVGSGFRYELDGVYIVVYGETDSRDSHVKMAVKRNVSGVLLDDEGNPHANARLELLTADGAKSTTNTFGRFTFAEVPCGNHIIKIIPADGSVTRYREMNVQSGNDSEVQLSLVGADLRMAEDKTKASVNPPTHTKITAYYVTQEAADQTVRAFSDDAKTEFSFVPFNRVNASYLPRAAVKTNLLYLAATTPNIAVEFALARKWTLDIVAGLNPWDLNSEKGGIRHGLVQPEVRYWFCNRFEKHFIGLHGIYGQYQIYNIDLAPFGNDLTDKRYEGWGAGGGISYGYHLPMAKRWAWEFTVGAGYLYLNYDKYNCGECDRLVGNRAKHYFGPTKAGVSLIFMIK